ncbi:MAG: hypothetical protein A3C02_02220 [Candidatus Andersenbacteria bacterium RIFCSPHIGHO2_02_FULL_45_11]|uniref:Uncharacterized protein n=1 Tax=Candidatus Andersenbacteria bacterium RIFCSPHIGHO2_12_FULL_45_11 TaxID=1797281 RepID=A0A1G1X1N9_9BACT|nr:MAG: hypothetical protein A2805_02675 [Candidatus Andersenbacteria bacterium RIFCSPHIGHO2_01_FULL_46_36]OGY32544.1 MAG: hypothetical protein A3C02_02220 [Candidatus Andersenbacteria bacterium RIFCSPHIGHO2_02_FULL_45_11]OGY33929.1 MAG: hypothetical protein A3D99_01705 [Candidatus Andersenbacteria bacterium RIFCSPHIGHO2_12_FULL_45_11]
MPGIVHLLAGAAIGALIPNTFVMMIVAFFSHYLLDFIPHIDPATFAAKERPYTVIQKIGLSVDVVLVFAFIISLFLVKNTNANIFIGAITALLTDILSPLEEYSVFAPLHKIHRFFHWDERRAKYWDWYITGLVSPIAVSAICVFILAKYT